MIKNRILREQSAIVGTIFTFFGISIIILKRMLIEFDFIHFALWGVSPEVACFVIASTAFALVIYLDETCPVETLNRTS